MDKFWKEAVSVVRSYLLDNIDAYEDGKISITDMSKQAVARLKEFYNDKYGDDGK